MWHKRCRWNSKQCRPLSDSSFCTLSLRRSLIWVCTVCSDLFVQKLRIITVLLSNYRGELKETNVCHNLSIGDSVSYFHFYIKTVLFWIFHHFCWKSEIFYFSKRFLTCDYTINRSWKADFIKFAAYSLLSLQLVFCLVVCLFVCLFEGFSWSLSVKQYSLIWAASSEFGTYQLCEQRRFRRACASAQSRQNLRCSLIQAVSQEEPSDRKPDP